MNQPEIETQELPEFGPMSLDEVLFFCGDFDLIDEPSQEIRSALEEALSYCETDVLERAQHSCKQESSTIIETILCQRANS